MIRAMHVKEGRAVSEMSIVDTFTKLIFGEEEQYSSAELQTIQALRMVDSNVALDSHRDMGIYLRALGVKEMIALVTQVQEQQASGSSVVLPAMPGHPASGVRPH
jgi:hypothetical protein